MLRWACERAGFGIGALARRIPQLASWERGEKQPTLKQLEDFARATHAPLGFLLLPEPPAEQVPIPDNRTVARERIDHPSPDLLDMLYLCHRSSVVAGGQYSSFPSLRVDLTLPLRGRCGGGAPAEGVAKATNRDRTT